MLRQCFLQSLNGTARFDGYGEVRPGVLDDFIQPRRRQNQVRAGWRISPAEFRPVAPWDYREPSLIREPQNFRQFPFRPGSITSFC